MTIYIVTDGCYSDYSIRGVFTTKENAEKFMSAYDFDDPHIEEYESDKMDEQINKGLKHYEVRMRKDGNMAKAYLVRFEYWSDYKDDISKEREYVPRSALNLNVFNAEFRDTGHEIIKNTVWAKDEAHAIKIANEKRTRCIAENRWIIKD